MAQFYATIKGTRGEASRLGNKSTGIVANVNGWEGGIRVVCGHTDGMDVFAVYLTHGSNGRGSETIVGILHVTAKGCLGWEAFRPGSSEPEEQHCIGSGVFEPTPKTHKRARAIRKRERAS